MCVFGATTTAHAYRRIKFTRHPPRPPPPGNNDMLNLTSKKTLDAKMRVKSDIFAGWEEAVDHQVSQSVSQDRGRGWAGSWVCTS